MKDALDLTPTRGMVRTGEPVAWRRSHRMPLHPDQVYRSLAGLAGLGLWLKISRDGNEHRTITQSYLLVLHTLDAHEYGFSPAAFATTAPSKSSRNNHLTFPLMPFSYQLLSGVG